MTTPPIDLASVPDLTPDQKRLMLALVKRIVADSMADGIRAAAAMVRLAPAHLSRKDLADLIERTANA